jgi:hypothetical protein
MIEKEKGAGDTTPERKELNNAILPAKQSVVKNLELLQELNRGKYLPRFH